MAYRLKDAEGMATGLRRIVAEQLSDAATQLRSRTDETRDDAIHEARKDLKKARAALRLTRGDLPGDVRRAENATYRDAGRRLSGPRDATVLLLTLEKVQAESGVAVPANAAADLRRVLEHQRDALAAAVDADEGAIDQVADDLDQARDRAAAWTLQDEGFATARAALRRNHQRGRRAMAAALESGEEGAWHEWRKRVKDLWYSARILERVAPEQLGGLVAESDRLAEILGDHNDVAVFLDAVAREREQLAPGHAELLRSAAIRRRDRLRRAAVPLGQRLYADRPGAFARRLDACWQARETQAAADARWLAPEAAGLVRELLERRLQAVGPERRRVTEEIRGLGFSVTELATLAEVPPAAFGGKEFDALVGDGVIRLGTPPTATALAGRKERRAPQGAEHAAEPEPGPDEPPEGEPARRHNGTGGLRSPFDVVRLGLGIAEQAARQARRILPL
jgi:CHAD domain-containing protein